MSVSHWIDFICGAPITVFAILVSLLTIPEVRHLLGKKQDPVDKTEMRVILVLMIAGGACGLRLLSHAAGIGE